MPYICENCENKTSFSAVHDVTQWGTENVKLDEEGDVKDSYGFYCDNSEVTDVTEMKCESCDSENITHVSRGEWDAWEGPEKELDPDEKEEDESWQEFIGRRSNQGR